MRISDWSSDVCSSDLSAQRGVIDAAEWIGPADDRNLGLQKIWKYYYLQGLHQQNDVGQIFINGDFWKSLPPDLQEIVKVAAKASIAETFNADIYNNSVALHQFQEKDGVKVLDTPEDYYPKFIAAEKKVTAKYAAENPRSEEHTSELQSLMRISYAVFCL